jgi:hypothetical protein
MRVGDGSRDGRIVLSPEPARGPPPRSPRQLAPKAEAEEEPSPFARVLRGLGREIDRGEQTMRRAIGSGSGGVDLGPAALLALQAGVYRYSEAVDLAAKLVDRASSGVKTVLQGQ